MIVFLIIPFLFVGAIAYLICAAIPMLRRFAMPSSLWILSLSVGVYLWAAVVLVVAIGHDQWNAHAHQLHLWHFREFSLLQSKALSAASIVALIATCVGIASAVTLVHQAIIHRVTLALFRLYVAGVSFGVGIVFFLPGLLLAMSEVPKLTAQLAISAVTLLVALVSAFVASAWLGWFCFHRASQFRGDHPRNLPIATRDEFYSVDSYVEARP